MGLFTYGKHSLSLSLSLLIQTFFLNSQFQPGWDTPVLYFKIDILEIYSKLKILTVLTLRFKNPDSYSFIEILLSLTQNVFEFHPKS